MVELLIFDPSVVVGFVLIVAVVWRWFAVPEDARRSEYILVLAIFALIVGSGAQAVADSMSQLRPMKMDLFAYAADGYLGQPAFVLGRVVAPHTWAKVLLNEVYGLLPIAVIVTLAAHILRRNEGVSAMVWAFVLNMVVAPALYMVVPVCGPKFAFPMFPVSPGNVIPHMVAIDAAPNGMPSVHMSTVLLIVWFTRRSRVGLAAAVVYLLLMVVATLASGQHYGVDLLAAVPYEALVAWLGKVAAARFRVPKTVHG